MMGTLTFERWAPLISSALVLLLAYLTDFELPLDGRKEALSATVSVGAIFAGFLGTTKAIMMSLPVNGLPSKLRASGYMEDLAKYMAEALCGSLGICVISVAGFFAIAQSHAELFGAVWAAGATHAVVSFWRVSRIMLLILRIDPEKM